MSIKLIYNEAAARYEAVCLKEERFAAKEAGFFFDFNGNKRWFTTNAAVAARLKHYADPTVVERIEHGLADAQPKVRFQNGTFFFVGGYEFKDAPKSAGFRWNPQAKRWETSDARIAERLNDYADVDAREEIDAQIGARMAAAAASRAIMASVNTELRVPTDLGYRPFQQAGIQYALGREATLIGDDMGLGKTVQAIGTLNNDDSWKSVVFIVPASLKVNWERELRKWLVSDASIGIASGKDFPETDIVIINYDILKKHHKAMHGRAWDYVILDEAHYVRNPQAARTKEIFGEWDYRTKSFTKAPLTGTKRIALTGTPIPNRVKEIWGLLTWLRPDLFPPNGFFTFARKYCGAHKKWAGRRQVWDFDGATDLDELQMILRENVMVRRLKSEVLTELPAKIRQIISLPAPKGVARLLKTAAKSAEAHETEINELLRQRSFAILDSDHETYMEVSQKLADAERIAFDKMSEVRHELAIAKIPQVVEHVDNALEGGKVVVMAHHYDMVDGLAAALREKGHEVVTLTGRDSQEARQYAVDAFQTDDNVKVFIGNIQAAGVGLTLTASSHVVFAELDWVPGNVTQAEDRCHRMGQTDTVLVQHLVIDGTLDARMVHTLVEKQRVMDNLLDVDHGEYEDEFVTPELAVNTAPVYLDWGLVEAARLEQEVRDNQKAARAERAAARQEEVIEGRLLRNSVDVLAAAGIPAEVKAAIHKGVQTLASYCDGAKDKDDAGFAKSDVALGKHIASLPALDSREAAVGALLVRHYHRQLPDDVVKVVTDFLGGL